MAIIHLTVHKNATPVERLKAICEAASHAEDESAYKFIEKVSAGLERELIMSDGYACDSLEEATEDAGEDAEVITMVFGSEVKA